MKKVFSLLLVISLFSCKKKANWDCACEIKPGGTFTTLKKTKYPKTTKSSATSSCEEFGKSELAKANEANNSTGGTSKCVVQESVN